MNAGASPFQAEFAELRHVAPRPRMFSAARRSPATTFAAAGVFVVVYGLAAELSDAVAAAGGGVAAWFPPVGLSLAVVLVAGRRGIALVVLADALQLAARGQGGAGEIVVLALLQGAIWGFVGLSLRPHIRTDPPLSRMRELGWFAFAGVIGGALLAGFVGTAALLGLRDGDWSQYWELAREYFVGDGIGVLTVTPAVLVGAAWLRGDLHTIPRPLDRWRHESVLSWTALVVTPVLAVAAFDSVLLPIAPLPVAYIALRTGITGASLAVGVWSVAAALAYWVAGPAISLDVIAASLLSAGLLALCIGAVVSERERGRARLAHLALHDEATGLPNARAITGELGEALGGAAAGSDDVSVIAVRCNRFEAIGALEPAVRQAILREVVRRLTQVTSADATLARLEPGHFVVVLDGPAAGAAADHAEKIRRVMERPVVVGDQEQLLEPVIGIACSGPGIDPAQLIERAWRAADTVPPGQRIASYDEHLHAELSGLTALGDALKRALVNDELHVAYQPIVSVDDDRLIGAEALLRWTDPQRGPVPPGEFIPVAEQCGLILPLGRWVLEQACSDAAAWPQVDGPQPVVHVNVSSVQLRDERFPSDVRAALGRSGLPPAQLCLELTETAGLDDLEIAALAVDELTALGVHVVLDDFGTGHSSLRWLQRLPVDAIKIDRSFVAGIDGEAVDFAIVDSTLGLARAMELASVAEGVETQAQLEALRSLGCPAVQGFLVCRPVPEPMFTEWCEDYVAGTGGSAPAPTA